MCDRFASHAAGQPAAKKADHEAEMFSLLKNTYRALLSINPETHYRAVSELDDATRASTLYTSSFEGARG